MFTEIKPSRVLKLLSKLDVAKATGWICNKVLTDLFNLSLKSREFPDNGVLSEKSTLKCGVPQGSILGPFLFLVYINDLSAVMDYVSTRMYADDTNLTFTACSIPKPQQNINVDLRYLQTYLIASRLTLNVLKTEYILIGSRQR